MNVFLSVVGISFYLIALASITCSVVSTLCDITGTVYDIFNFLLLNEDRTIQCNGNLNIFRKVSSHGWLVLRLNINSSRIWNAGCKHYYGVSARLFNDKEKGKKSLNERISTVKFLDTSRELKGINLKLVIHKQSESSEIHLVFLENELSEANKKYLELIIKNDVLNEKKFLKDDSEVQEFNMLVDLDEMEKILVQKIQFRWNSKEKRFININEVIFKPQILVFAYTEMIKSKSLNIKGENNNKIDSINLQKIVDLSRSLMEGSWWPGIGRRVLIPKNKSRKFRSLTVLSIYDKVVASAIKIVLNFIFEKHKGLDMLPKERYFHKTSYGFRPHKNCHSALRIISSWSLAPWFIQINIKRCFDTIDQKRLMLILKESINDQLLVDILYKLFLTRVIGVEKGGPDASKGVGIPQGNPLSPLLANVYLNELDQCIKFLKKEIDKGKNSNVKIKECDKTVYMTAVELFKVKLKEVKKMGILRKIKIDKQQSNIMFHLLYYLRYADDYLIAVNGPKWLAKKIKKRIENFLKFNLFFQLKYSELKHCRDNKVRFLGFDIKVLEKKEGNIVETRKILSFRKLRNRISSRKRSIEYRFEKAIFHTYESEKLKILKYLMQGRKIKMSIKEAGRLLALKDATELNNLIKLQGNKWILGQELFSEWIDREYSRLRSSWIKKTEIEKLGFSQVNATYHHFLEILDQVRNKKNLDKFKKKELKRIKVNSKFKQSHVDKILYGISQGLNVKIYAPISEFKDKMRIWGMLSDGRNPKASGVIFRYHDIFIIEYYKQKALGFLSYYKPAMNFHGVKKLVDYHLRWSLLHTLAGKHNLKIHQVIKNYGKTPEILLEEKSGKKSSFG